MTDEVAGEESGAGPGVAPSNPGAFGTIGAREGIEGSATGAFDIGGVVDEATGGTEVIGGREKIGAGGGVTTGAGAFATGACTGAGAIARGT